MLDICTVLQKRQKGFQIHPFSSNELNHDHSLESQWFVSSDRSSYSDDGLLYIYPQRQLFQIFTQSIDAIDVTSVTLSRLNSINAIDI